MKKLIAILLCLAMGFSLIACADLTGTSSSSVQESGTEDENDKTDGSDKTDEADKDNDTGSSMAGSAVDSGSTGESTDNSGTSGSGTTDSSVTSSSKDDGTDTDVPSKPNYVPDRTSYVARSAGDGENAVIYYINEVMKYPTLTPYYNGYKSALTMTFDDGYDTNTGTIVSDVFEKYGWRGTMMLGPCFLGGDGVIEEWNNIFARGYLDVGCHGYNHQEPTTLSSSEYEHEIKDAIMFLREKFPGQRVLTFATPYAHINDAYEEYLSQYAIGNRLEAGGSTVNLSDNLDFNPYRIKAISVNKSATLSKVHDSVEMGVEYGNWTVELFHCVLPNASNGTDISQSTFEYHCDYLYRNFRDDIWFATFEEVLIYAEELKHTTVAYTDCDRETMTFKVTPDGSLDKEIYNIPLSVTIYLPERIADSAYAMVNGEYQALEYNTEYTTGYEYVVVKNISPGEETEIVIHLGGNKTMKNNCVVHKYYEEEVVEPTHETFGYTLNKCSKCEHTYYSAFTNPVHDYTGAQEVVIEPTVDKKGFTKYYCTQCDKYEVKETPKLTAE